MGFADSKKKNALRNAEFEKTFDTFIMQSRAAHEKKNTLPPNMFKYLFGVCVVYIIYYYTRVCSVYARTNDDELRLPSKQQQLEASSSPSHPPISENGFDDILQYIYIYLLCFISNPGRGDSTQGRPSCARGSGVPMKYIPFDTARSQPCALR